MAKFNWERLFLERKDGSRRKAEAFKNRKSLPASDKQLQLLSRLNYRKLVGLTIGRASDLIDLSKRNGWQRFPQVSAQRLPRRPS